ILIFLSSWSILEFAHLQSWISYNPISGKGLKDLPFLAFYVIVFSFLRQAVIKYFVKTYATWLGLRGTKLQRFVDQGYAIFYWGSSTIICFF
ncbi:hypothetical protein PPACK8108_LOCUS6512, partial [Phakopsora pachyrhizi]